MMLCRVALQIGICVSQACAGPAVMFLHRLPCDSIIVIIITSHVQLNLNVNLNVLGCRIHADNRVFAQAAMPCC